jgi:hypothetical protein
VILFVLFILFEQVPKLCTYVKCGRRSVFDELQELVPGPRNPSSATGGATLQEAQQLEYVSSLDSSRRSDGGVQVRVVSLSKSRLSGEEEWSTGRLVRLLPSVPISQPAFLPPGTVPENCAHSRPLVHIWRGAGFTYSEEQAGTVFQVLVQFGALTFAGQGSGSAVRSGHDEDPRGAVYSYPADKVFRIDSGGVKVSGVEVEAINASLERDWISSRIEAVPVGLPCKGEGSCAGQTLQVLILIAWFYCR